MSKNSAIFRYIKIIFAFFLIRLYDMKMLQYNDIIKIIIDSSSVKTTNTVIRDIEEILTRNILERKPVKVITGLRRSGKSFILKRLYTCLLEKGIPKKNILYINFEHDRLANYLTVTDLRNVYETFLTRIDNSKRVYLFMDEIQNIEMWEKFIRTVYDSTDYEIYITGSNSHLLSSEFTTALGGRIMEFRVFPFSISEILEYNDFDYHNNFVLQEKYSHFSMILDNYLNFGGLPETLLLSDTEKEVYKSSLMDKIILKDISTRYEVRNIPLFQKIVGYLVDNTGSIFINSKVAGYAGTNDNTVERYVSHLENSFLIERINKLEWKSKKKFTSQKKYYFADVLFISKIRNSGKTENIVFNQLRRLYDLQNIFFYRNEKGQEIDFIIRISPENWLCIQVCVELADDNSKREFRSLDNLLKYRLPEEIENDKYVILYRFDNRKENGAHRNIDVILLDDFLLNPDIITGKK